MKNKIKSKKDAHRQKWKAVRLHRIRPLTHKLHRKMLQLERSIAMKGKLIELKKQADEIVRQSGELASPFVARKILNHIKSTIQK
jgi:hypothetical protein